MVSVVFFDVGETLVDETYGWGLWADRLGVPRLTFFAALGVLIAQRRDHREVFQIFRPGFDLEAELKARGIGGASDEMDIKQHLYPDAVPCLKTLRDRGFRVGIAGNQPKATEVALTEMNLGIDFIASSEGWGVSKPSPSFFEKIVELANVPAHEIAYVGDRLDNDVIPAAKAGMVAIFLKRGPWGYAQAAWPEAAQARYKIDSLDELLKVVRQI